MAKKRKAFLHVGLDDGSGDFVGAALGRHRRSLHELGVSCPAESGEEMFRAALELLRIHADWGYRRSEVEGAWTDVWRRAEKEKGRNDVLVSQTQLAAARSEQVDLALDALSAFHVHVVVGSDRRQVWKRLGKVVGFGISSLPLDDVTDPPRARPPHLASPARAHTLEVLGRGWAELLAQSTYDVVGDPTDLVPAADRVGSPAVSATVTERALNDALHEVERLTRRNESLELRVEALEKKRRKLKKRLEAVA